MKKIYILAVLSVAMNLVACSGNKATSETLVRTLAEKVQSGDTTAVMAAMETVQDELKRALKKGDIEKASTYANSIKAFLEENAQKILDFDNIEIVDNRKNLYNIIEVIKLYKEQQILQRAGYIFLNLPDHKDLDNVDKSVFSSSFRELLEKAFAYEEKLEKEGTIDLEEIYLWYCGVDSGCDDCLQGFSLKSADEKTAIVKVRYNTFGNIDVHEMKLVYSDGQWYCDNWDNMREIIQEGLKRAYHK